MLLTWEATAVAVAAAAETNWKHKVTPDWGDLITDSAILRPGFTIEYDALL